MKIKYSYIDNKNQQEWEVQLMGLPHTLIKERATQKSATQALIEAIEAYQEELFELRCKLRKIIMLEEYALYEEE